MPTQAIPSTHRAATPYIIVRDAVRAIDFYTRSFGATETMAITDQFDGDRRGSLTDPFGHMWLLATKKEDVPYAEMQRRFEKMMAQAQA